MVFRVLQAAQVHQQVGVVVLRGDVVGVQLHGAHRLLLRLLKAALEAQRHGEAVVGPRPAGLQFDGAPQRLLRLAEPVRVVPGDEAAQRGVGPAPVGTRGHGRAEPGLRARNVPLALELHGHHVAGLGGLVALREGRRRRRAHGVAGGVHPGHRVGGEHLHRPGDKLAGGGAGHAPPKGRRRRHGKGGEGYFPCQPQGVPRSGGKRLRRTGPPES